ncbi:MAG: hypothetical protein ACI9K2_006812 [Myxococcota bacterium]|jgi:hypothetical protein
MVLALILALTGCKKVEEAPKDLDALAHFFWDEFDAEDERLVDGVANLHDAVNGERLDATEDGTLTPLTHASIGVVGLKNKEPAKAQGLYIAGTYACDLDTLQAILSYPDQAELYSNAYVEYDRTLTTSRQKFLDGSAPDVSWDVRYVASIIGAKFTANITADLRRVSHEESLLGDALVARVWAPKPVVFDKEGTSKNIEQDYQIEVWYERDRGEVVHLYGMWREASFGTGFEIDDDGVQRIMLNNMDAWDRDTEKLCEDGAP